ncbi:MAG: hypothetical protein E6Q06_02395 [Candidatus Moraniibacteriota bacterium]|nr:MAG: hypothetical protein E6Q06_02395 [Candidatus Moranbacteria bacterium]
MLWLFEDGKGKVTRTEFKESVIPRLRNRGLSDDDIRFVRAVLDQALNEDGSQRGITDEEIDDLVENLKENAPDHFSDENLTKVEEELRRKL